MIHQEAQGRVTMLMKKTYINRSIKVRGGLIHPCKRRSFLLEKTFGYSKVGEGKQRHLK
jgi:hypothetical protein